MRANVKQLWLARVRGPNLTQRLTTVALLLPFIILLALLGGAYFTALVVVVASLCLLEIVLLARRQALQRPSFALGLIVVFSLAYVGLPAVFSVMMRARPDGLFLISLACCITWCADTSAYIAGKLFGKTPLAPRLSPLKTVEGALGALAGGSAAALAFLALTGRLTPTYAALALAAPAFAVAGDLLESGVKRYFGVKDSRLPGLDLLPGHGGVLDRMDSYLAVATSVYLHTILFTGSAG